MKNAINKIYDRGNFLAILVFIVIIFIIIYNHKEETIFKIEISFHVFKIELQKREANHQEDKAKIHSSRIFQKSSKE